MRMIQPTSKLESVNHEEFTESLRLIGFCPSYADPDMYIKDHGTHYEYICMYVDDILFFSKSSVTVINSLKSLYILKGVGEPEFYLGADISKAKVDGKVRTTIGAKTYIKNITDKIENLLDIKLRNYGSPMDPNYHPFAISL